MGDFNMVPLHTVCLLGLGFLHTFHLGDREFLHLEPGDLFIYILGISSYGVWGCLHIGPGDFSMQYTRDVGIRSVHTVYLCGGDVLSTSSTMRI